MSKFKEIRKELKNVKSLRELKKKRGEDELIASVNNINDKKASKFLDAINKYAKEQKEEINRETEKFKAEELKKAEDEVLNDAYKLIQNEMAEMKKEITSKISKEKIDLRKKLFKKRNDIKAQVFKSAKDNLIEYTKSDEYKNLMSSCLKNITKTLTEPGTILYLNKNDVKLSDILKKEFKANSNIECEIKVSDDITIGGILAYNAEMGLVIDETLDSKLEEQFEWFGKNSGLNLA